MFDETEERQARRVIVMGATVATELFPNIDPVGQTVQPVRLHDRCDWQRGRVVAAERRQQLTDAQGVRDSRGLQHHADPATRLVIELDDVREQGGPW